MTKEEITKLQEENENLKTAIDTAKKLIQERDDEVSAHAAEIEELAIQLKAVEAAVPQKPIYVKVEWKNPQGKTEKREVTITTPKVRIKDLENPINARALLQVATGKEADEELSEITQEKAIAEITHWAKIGAGFVLEK